MCFSDLLHCVWQTLGPAASLRMSQFCSFLWLSNSPLCMCRIPHLLSPFIQPQTVWSPVLFVCLTGACVSSEDCVCGLQCVARCLQYKPWANVWWCDPQMNSLTVHKPWEFRVIPKHAGQGGMTCHYLHQSIHCLLGCQEVPPWSQLSQEREQWPTHTSHPHTPVTHTHGFSSMPRGTDVLLLLFSHPVMPDSLQPHGLRHTRLPCPSLSPGVWSSSCLLNQWCHPTISSSVAPFSSYPQSFPASGSFPRDILV